MPEEQSPYKSSQSVTDVLVHKKISVGSYSSGTSESNFFVPEVEFASASGNDSGVDSPRNCEHQPLLARMQCDSLNVFPGKCLVMDSRMWFYEKMIRTKIDTSIFMVFDHITVFLERLENSIVHWKFDCTLKSDWNYLFDVQKNDKNVFRLFEDYFIYVEKYPLYSKN